MATAPMAPARIRRLMRAPDTQAAQREQILREARYRGIEAGRLLGQAIVELIREERSR